MPREQKANVAYLNKVQVKQIKRDHGPGMRLVKVKKLFMKVGIRPNILKLIFILDFMLIVCFCDI